MTNIAYQLAADRRDELLREAAERRRARRSSREPAIELPARIRRAARLVVLRSTTR